MTNDKARKTAIRMRMAETGEPYSVARRAVEDEAPQTPNGEYNASEFHENESHDERYIREAREAGASGPDLDAMRAEWAARTLVDRMRRAADEARQLADEAEEAASRAEERAELAQESAELAEEWADENERMLAHERAAYPVRLTRSVTAYALRHLETS